MFVLDATAIEYGRSVTGSIHARQNGCGTGPPSTDATAIEYGKREGCADGATTDATAIEYGLAVRQRVQERQNGAGSGPPDQGTNR